MQRRRSGGSGLDDGAGAPSSCGDVALHRPSGERVVSLVLDEEWARAGVAPTELPRERRPGVPVVTGGCASGLTATTQPTSAGDLSDTGGSGWVQWVLADPIGHA